MVFKALLYKLGLESMLGKGGKDNPKKGERTTDVVATAPKPKGKEDSYNAPRVIPHKERIIFYCARISPSEQDPVDFLVLSGLDGLHTGKVISLSKADYELITDELPADWKSHVKRTSGYGSVKKMGASPRKDSLRFAAATYSPALLGDILKKKHISPRSIEEYLA